MIANNTGSESYVFDKEQMKYKRSHRQYPQHIFKYGILGKIKKSGRIEIYDEMKLNEDPQDNSKAQHQEFPEDIKEAIMNRRVVVASNAALEGTMLATYWIVTTINNTTKICGGIETKNQDETMILAEEALRVLDLIKAIAAATKNIQSREIVVYLGNKRVLYEYHKQVNKESNVTMEAGAIIAEMKDEIEKATIDITLVYSNNKPRARKFLLTTRTSTDESM